MFHLSQGCNLLLADLPKHFRDLELEKMPQANVRVPGIEATRAVLPGSTALILHGSTTSYLVLPPTRNFLYKEQKRIRLQ